MKKFKEAGIDLKDMSNATYDNTGLHITLSGGEVVDVKTENLDNFVNYVNEVAKEEEHFLPIWNSETKESFIYTFDKENKTWSLSEVLEPLVLSIDVNSAGKCTYKDVISGHLVESLRTLNIIFPADAINAGWEDSEATSLSNLILNHDSKEVMQLVSICKISDDFLELPNRQSYIASVAVLNIDNSTGYINFLLDHKKALDWFLDKLENTNGTGIEIVRWHPDDIVQDSWNGDYAPSARLYKTQGEKNIMTAVNKLQINGVLPTEIEKLLITPN
jgi:hypothetical protein